MQIETAAAHVVAEQLLGFPYTVGDGAASDVQLGGDRGDAALVFEVAEQRLAQRAHRGRRGCQGAELALDEVPGAVEILGQQSERRAGGVVQGSRRAVPDESRESFGPLRLCVASPEAVDAAPGKS